MGDFSVKAKLENAGINIGAFEDGVVEAFQLQCGQIATAARDEWVRIAQSRLKTSREFYVQGLRQAESYKMTELGSGGVKFEITLVGDMANNVEFGMGSFDMKAVRPGWLGGGKSKTGKNGKKYVTIPFRHSTGNSPRFADTGKAAAVGLKAQLRTAVKNYGLDRMIKTGTGQVVEGVAGRIPNNATDVHPYLRGLTRTQTVTAGSLGTRGQGTLTTFRRLSENSKPEAWIHPGIQAVNIMPEVEAWMDTQLDKVIEMMLGA